MKVVIAGSRELLAENIGKFLKTRGHEVVFLVKDPSREGDLSFEIVRENGLLECDVVINIPEKMILENRLGSQFFEKEFFETRIEPTRFLKESILKSSNPPRVWISFSSVGCYPKETANFYKESDELGTDIVAELIKKWEEAATLPEGFQTRQLITRLGLLISKHSGLLSKLLPLFRWGIGSIMGQGDEAFPWIYQKDLYWFLDYAMHKKELSGIYNTVAPQLIDSKEFSKALSKVMHKPILFKFPRRFFSKRLGDTADIVFSKSLIFPSRILKSGFEFRYPAIYPALVDCLSKGSHF